jgi:tetratricopeptide (TPR) repeat protein
MFFKGAVMTYLDVLMYLLQGIKIDMIYEVTNEMVETWKNTLKINVEVIDEIKIEIIEDKRLKEKFINSTNKLITQNIEVYIILKYSDYKWNYTHVLKRITYVNNPSNNPLIEDFLDAQKKLFVYMKRQSEDNRITFLNSVKRLNSNPNNYQNGYYLMAQYNNVLNQYRNAHSLLLKIEKYYSYNLEFYIFKASCNYNLKEFEKSKEDLEKIFNLLKNIKEKKLRKDTIHLAISYMFRLSDLSRILNIVTSKMLENKYNEQDIIKYINNLNFINEMYKKKIFIEIFTSVSYKFFNQGNYDMSMNYIDKVLLYDAQNINCLLLKLSIYDLQSEWKKIIKIMHLLPKGIYKSEEFVYFSIKADIYLKNYGEAKNKTNMYIKNEEIKKYLLYQIKINEENIYEMDSDIEDTFHKDMIFTHQILEKEISDTRNWKILFLFGIIDYILYGNEKSFQYIYSAININRKCSDEAKKIINILTKFWNEEITQEENEFFRDYIRYLKY